MHTIPTGCFAGGLSSFDPKPNPDYSSPCFKWREFRATAVSAVPQLARLAQLRHSEYSRGTRETVPEYGSTSGVIESRSPANRGETL